jgi:hypothetical protein
VEIGSFLSCPLSFRSSIVFCIPCNPARMFRSCSSTFPLEVFLSTNNWLVLNVYPSSSE